MLNTPHENIAKNLEDTIRYLSMSRTEHLLREYARNVLFYLCGQARASSYEGWIVETVARIVKEEAAKRAVAEDGMKLKNAADYRYEGADAEKVLTFVGDENNATLVTIPEEQAKAIDAMASQPFANFKIVCDETPVEENAAVIIGDTIIPVGIHDTKPIATETEEIDIPDVPKTLVEMTYGDRVMAYIAHLSAVWPTMDDDMKDSEAEYWVENALQLQFPVAATVTCQTFTNLNQSKKVGAIYNIIVAWHGEGAPIDEFVFDTSLYGIPAILKTADWLESLTQEFSVWLNGALPDFIEYLKGFEGHGAVVAQPLAQYVKKRLEATFEYARICGPDTLPRYTVEIGQESSHTFVNYTISILIIENAPQANRLLARTTYAYGDAHAVLPLIQIPGHLHGFRRAGSVAIDERAHEFVQKVGKTKTKKADYPKLFDKGFKRNQFGVLITINGVSHTLESSAVKVEENRLYLTHFLTTDVYNVSLIDAITVIMFDEANTPRVSFLYDVIFDEEIPVRLDLSTGNVFGLVEDAYQVTAFEINSCRTINPAAEDDAAA
ncbi:hypothetical protein EVB87_257 [Rhizobium phage RHph_N28_1]|nr:hypothetical protein EVB87_257 [Rhizobium phage RHph_N28_1]QIG74286.1 hypothetical protein EVC07_258 [Rhizobium phage RHph_N42]